MKYLAHYVIYNSIIYSNSICSLNNGSVNIHPFSNEVEGTSFVNGAVLITNRDLSEHISLFREILANATDIKKGTESILKFIIEKFNAFDETNKNYFILPVAI